jgi:transposase-like protein
MGEAMGDRYFITVICPKCGEAENDVYYAPTCGFLAWKCPKCKKRVNLEKYTGISKEDASNRVEIEALVKSLIKTPAIVGK